LITPPFDAQYAALNVASNAGIMGQPCSAAYCASKGGVINLTRALAVESRDQGVRVNVVAPGRTVPPHNKGCCPRDDATVAHLARGLKNYAPAIIALPNGDSLPVPTPGRLLDANGALTNIPWRHLRGLWETPAREAEDRRAGCEDVSCCCSELVFLSLS